MTARNGIDASRCRACGRDFNHTTTKNDPVVCWRRTCQATQWPTDRWREVARFAAIRRACGLPLSLVDAQALQRHPQEVTA